MNLHGFERMNFLRAFKPERTDSETVTSDTDRYYSTYEKLP